MKKYARKDNGRDGSGSPDAIVARVVPMLFKCGINGHHHGPDVEEYKIQRSHETKIHLVSLFNCRTEKIQHQHVYQQMGPVCMQQGMRKEAVPFPVSVNDVRIESMLQKQIVLLKSLNGEKGRTCNNDVCNQTVTFGSDSLLL